MAHLVQSRRSSAGADKWLDVQVFDSAEVSAGLSGGSRAFDVVAGPSHCRAADCAVHRPNFSRKAVRLAALCSHSSQDCLLRAKRLGYQVVATHLRADAVDISQVDWTRPTAFVMGNEEKGEGRQG